MSNKIEGQGLVRFGFIRVDGLSYTWKSSGQCHASRERVRADKELYGTFAVRDSRCGTTAVVVTRVGEVWIGSGKYAPGLWEVIHRLCDKQEDNGHATTSIVFKGAEPLFNITDILRSLRECSQPELSDECREVTV